jgi:hypothetical protein
MLAAPGQYPAVDVWPSEAHSERVRQAPATPCTEQAGGGVQHSSEAGPGQWPAVEVYPGLAAHTVTSMHVPATPPTLQVGADDPEELLLELLEEELLEEELLEEELLEEELLLDEVVVTAVQHSMLEAPGQRPAVDLWFACAAQALVEMQVPWTPATEQVAGGVEVWPPNLASAAWAWAMRFEESQAPQIS